jgi:hypothetical protein
LYNPALLAGLRVFLSMLEIMENQGRTGQFKINRPSIFRKRCVDTYDVTPECAHANVAAAILN